MEECGLCDPRTDYDPYHPLLENGRIVVIVTNIPIHAEQKSWDGGDKRHAPSPFRKRRIVTPKGRSERQGVCIDVEGSMGLHIVAEEAGRPCDALECLPCELLNHHLVPCCEMDGQEGATLASALFLVRDHGLTPCLLEG